MNQTIAEAIKSAADLLSLLIAGAKEIQTGATPEASGVDLAGFKAVQSEMAMLREEVRSLRQALSSLVPKSTTIVEPLSPADAQDNPVAQDPPDGSAVGYESDSRIGAAAVINAGKATEPMGKNPSRAVPKTAVKSAAKQQGKPASHPPLPAVPLNQSRVESPQVTPRKRGRPAGSKNKPKADAGSSKPASEPEPAGKKLPSVGRSENDLPPIVLGDVPTTDAAELGGWSNIFDSKSGAPLKAGSISIGNEPASTNAKSTRDRVGLHDASIADCGPTDSAPSHKEINQISSADIEPSQLPAEVQVADKSSVAVKRRPGRPPGAKDKVKRKSPRDRHDREGDVKIRPRKPIQEVPPLPRLIVPDDEPSPAINYLANIDPNAVAIPAFVVDAKLVLELDLSMLNPGNTWNLYRGRNAFHDDCDDQIFNYRPAIT